MFSSRCNTWWATCVSWWSAGNADKTTVHTWKLGVLCSSSGCMEQSVSELVDRINIHGFQKPTRDILVWQRISTVSQSTSSEGHTVVILVTLRRLIRGFVPGGFWPMVNFWRSTPSRKRLIVHKMYDSWARGHRRSRDVAVFARNCGRLGDSMSSLTD